MQLPQRDWLMSDLIRERATCMIHGWRGNAGAPPSSGSVFALLDRFNFTPTAAAASGVSDRVSRLSARTAGVAGLALRCWGHLGVFAENDDASRQAALACCARYEAAGCEAWVCGPKSGDLNHAIRRPA
jgi:hypothetical protein